MRTPEDHLRLLLGERVPEGLTESDTLFSDEELSDILNHHNDNMAAAAAEGWLIKAAEYAALIDTSESGSTRKMSQKHRHAMIQADHYTAQAQVSPELIAANARSAIVARSARWATPASEELPSKQNENPVGIEPYAVAPRSSRPFPTKRFYQIKR